MAHLTHLWATVPTPEPVQPNDFSNEMGLFSDGATRAFKQDEVQLAMKGQTTLISLMAAVVFAAVAGPVLFAANSDETIPLMRRAEPAIVKAGETVTVFGQALDRSKVSDVMLTAEDKQIPVEVLEQTESFIRFRVPANLEPGRYYPAVLMAKESMVLVQPVILTVQARQTAPPLEPTK